MKTMNTKVYSCTLTSFNNFVFKLFLNFSNYFLNTCWVNTTISNKLVKSKTTYLTANRIESTYYNCFWRIINNDFYTCCSFKSADVSTFTAYDTSLYFIIFNMENTYRIFNRCLSSNSLYSLNNDLLCLLVSIQLSIVNNFINITCCI